MSNEMKLEQQVCKLKYSKKLEELGVEQDSYFWWNTACTDRKPVLDEHNYSERETYPFEVSYSAFTVAELGEMLPDKTVYQLLHRTDIDKWHLNVSALTMPDILEPTLADAMAKWLVYLIENKLIKKQNNGLRFVYCSHVAIHRGLKAVD